MIYFDNAATGGFKPRAVTDAAENVIRYLSANPGRSGHRLSITGAQIISSARESLGSFFNAPLDRVIFTKNCTEALNLAIFGTLKTGGHIITTTFEHNSVLRPLTALKNQGLIELDVVSPTENTDILTAIKNAVKANTYLIITTAVSNVTGEILPVRKIGEIAKERDLLYLVDGAQGGGHIPLDLIKDGISMLALAGHKGLYGIMGSGALLFCEGVTVEPLIYGGTGSESFNLNQPSIYPEKLEAGTHNLPAIAALKEGVDFISNNLSNFSKHLYSATEYAIFGLHQISGVKVYSTPNPAGIIAFSVLDKDSTDIADTLNADYDIAVRGGLHCAPLTHKYYGTDKTGLIRISLAVQNSSNEINYFIKAVNKIVGEVKSF